MIRMRASANPVRYAWVLLFALMLSLRLLGSAGFMPAFDHASLTLIACPDAELNAPLAIGTMHRHGHMQHARQPCPYAAAGALGATDDTFVPLIAIVLIGMTLLLGRAFAFLDRESRRDWPPAIGPPFSHLS